MMRQFALLFILMLLSASCGPGPAPVSTGTPLPTAMIPAHAPEIRFALVGEPRDVNVWELFDESGASYADYALRAEYWPRLYHLVPPELTFQPLAAEGMPAPVIQEGEFYSATVKLRPDLKWTDGSAFTAEDIAFTVNAALVFELGFDWNAHYSRDYLSRVEVVDPATVKFVFQQKPNVGIWQYGALQGPVVQRSFWEPIIGEASVLLPDEALRVQVEEARAYRSKIQAAVDDLTAQVNALRFNGQSDRKLEGSLSGSQNELIYARNTLDKLLEEYNVKMDSARAALYAMDDSGEPTLGTWISAGRQAGAWINEANPDFPFTQPNFDRAVYLAFAAEQDAEKAFKNNEVDMILGPHGEIPGQKPDDPGLVANLNGGAQFLVFNPANSALADPALRQAFACMVWFPSRSYSSPLNGFVLQGNNFWHDSDAFTPCSELTDVNISDLRWERIVRILKSAGYSWQSEPTQATTGTGLVMPDGQPVPAIKLLGLSSESNSMQAAEAKYIGEAATRLGIPISVEHATPQDVRYQVFSSKRYDMAILGWGLSLYPGYLCEWFGAGSPFDYGSDGLKSECEALDVESDLEAARRHVFEIQSILVEQLPFIPLYADIRYEAYRNIRYPFESVLGGFGDLYGAPSHAMPAQ